MCIRDRISCYVLLLISLAVYAQSGKESFAGRVVDTETYQPVSFATIRLLSLPDSTLLVGGATDINGKFQLSFIRKTPNKSLLLHVSFVGYKPVYQLVFNSQKTVSAHLGDISLTPESYALDETVVVGQAPMVITEGDTTVFNASAYRTPEGLSLIHIFCIHIAERRSKQNSRQDRCNSYYSRDNPL